MTARTKGMACQKDKYTRRELSLRPGIRQLAAAVLEQWVADGKPSSDQPSIDIWIRVMTYDDEGCHARHGGQ